MALSFASLTNFSKMQSGVWYSGSITPQVTVRCCETAKEPPPKSKLQVGSPIIIVEAPKFMKTAASMPCLRANAGSVKPGDVGRSSSCSCSSSSSSSASKTQTTHKSHRKHAFLNRVEKT